MITQLILSFTDAPQVSISLLPITVTQNRELKIVCEAKDGFPAVYKYKGFVHSYNGNTIPIIAPPVVGTPKNSSLHILSARLQDTGTYTCYVSNGINNTGIFDQRASVTINIKGKLLFFLINLFKITASIYFRHNDRNNY